MAEELTDDEQQDEEECPKCPPSGAPAWMATFADMATLLMVFWPQFYHLLNLMFKFKKFRILSSFWVCNRPVVEHQKEDCD